jgi:hypothetical protein
LDAFLVPIMIGQTISHYKITAPTANHAHSCRNRFQ